MISLLVNPPGSNAIAVACNWCKALGRSAVSSATKPARNQPAGVRCSKPIPSKDRVNAKLGLITCLLPPGSRWCSPFPHTPSLKAASRLGEDDLAIPTCTLQRWPLCLDQQSLARGYHGPPYS